MINLILFLLTAGIIGCSGGAAGSTPAALQPTNPSQAPTQQQVTLPYYSKSTVFTPTLFSGTLHTYPDITEIAYCAVYNANTYCWDNGVITTATGIGAEPTLYHTYWGLAMNGTILTGGGVQQFQNDAMQNPRTIDATLIGTLGQPAINAVLAGTQSQASCTLSNGVLDCGSFAIDTNQVPL